MTPGIHRRSFVKLAGTLGVTVPFVSWRTRPLTAAERAECSTPNAERIGWRVACQLYTFRRFSFYEALDKIASLGIEYVEPCFFLRLSKDRPELTTSEALSPELREELRGRLSKAGISMPNYYCNLGSDESACRKIFQFAKEMGAETLVSEPPAEAFDLIEDLCDEYAINLAVHNHPKSPNSKYWNPDSVLEVCDGRSKRIGGCCDTGHWVRSGLDPVECLKKMEGRIVTFHLKDVAEWGKPEARDVPLGTGKANYAAVLHELHRQGFKGVMAIEYEHDSPQLMEEVAECTSFVEKTAGTLL